MRDRRVAYVAAGISVALVIAAVWGMRATGLRATYYIDPDWQTPAYTIVDRRINLDTLTGNAPVSPDQPFSVHWFGYLNVPRDGTYRFSLKAEGTATASLAIAQDSSEHGQRFVAVDQPVDLGAGAHAIAVSYSHQRGRYGLEFLMAAEGEPPRPVSSTSLSSRTRSSLWFRTVAISEAAGVLTIGFWCLAGCVWIGRRVTPSVGVTLTVVTASLLLAIVFDRPGWIRGPAPYPIQWQWGYHAPDAVFRIPPALLGALGIVAAIVYLGVGDPTKNARQRARRGLAAAMAAGTLFQAGILHLGQGGFVATVGERTRNNISTGYFGTAADVTSIRELLASYAAIVAGFPVHARTHPPAPILYYRAVIRAADEMPSAASGLMRSLESMQVPIRRFGGTEAPTLASAAFISGFGTLIFGLLTCWLIARIAEASGADALSAAGAGALWALCPSAVFFLPTFDTVNTFLVAAACALGCVAATSSSRPGTMAAASAAGIAAGLGLFASFGSGPMLAAAGGVILATLAGPPVPWRRIALVCGLAVIGLMVVVIAPTLYGFDWLGTFRAILDIHRNHYTPPGRLLWLRFNLLDYSIFLGWPLVAWCALFLVRDRDWWANRLVVVTIVAVVVIDIADVTRSEVGRLWMPLMPPAFAAAGVAASGRARRFDFVWVAMLLAAVTITVSLYWWS